MELVIIYEDETYHVNWGQSLDELTFVDILGERPLLNCWLEDLAIKIWIRIPRIEVLKILLKIVPANSISKLRFQTGSESPNSTPRLTPTKKELETSENVDDEDTSIASALSIGDNVIEPFTQEPGANVTVDDLVVIQLSSDQSVSRLSLHADMLMQSIRINAENGINPFDVIVKAEDENHQLQEVKLTRTIWMNCLLRGNSKADLFLNYVLGGFRNLFMLGEKLQELQSKKDLWLRLKCFNFDLRRFDTAAQNRLENYGGEYYMSNRYFSSDELSYLLEFPTASGATARESLEALFMAKGCFSEVCTSHDVAPAVERIYGIRKGFEKEKEFIVFFKKFSKDNNVF